MTPTKKILKAKAKRLSLPVKKIEKPSVSPKLQKKSIKLPSPKKVRETPLKKSKPETTETPKKIKTLEKKKILKQEVSYNKEQIKILLEYKNYIDKWKIKNVTYEELDLLIKIQPNSFKDGLQNTLQKISKERKIKEKELFLELHNALNNSKQLLEITDLDSHPSFIQNIINLLKNHDNKVD